MTFECDERAEKFHSDHAYHHYHPDLGSISDTVVETNFQPIRSRGGGTAMYGLYMYVPL